MYSGFPPPKQLKVQVHPFFFFWKIVCIELFFWIIIIRWWYFLMNWHEKGYPKSILKLLFLCEHWTVPLKIIVNTRRKIIVLGLSCSGLKLVRRSTSSTERSKRKTSPDLLSFRSEPFILSHSLLFETFQTFLLYNVRVANMLFSSKKKMYVFPRFKNVIFVKYNFSVCSFISQNILKIFYFISKNITYLTF